MELIPAADTAGPIAHELDFTMYGYVEFVDRARALVAHAARAWRLAPEIEQDALVIVTELTGNACKLYTGQELTIWVRTPAPGSGLLTIGVTDPDPMRLPRVLVPGVDSESGRGLYMVRELAGGRLYWHARKRPPGKVVFAALGP
jgi:hypothetical protein